MPGITVQLKKTTDAVTYQRCQPECHGDAVQGLVDAVNAALGEIAKQSKRGHRGRRRHAYGAGDPRRIQPAA